MELSINRIYGTSSSHQLNVAVSTNLIAYVASGGVVVSHIDQENGQLTNQRFLCANNNHRSSPAATPQSTYNFQTITPEVEKDQYGVPKPSHTVQVEDQIQISDLSLNSPASRQLQQSQKIKTISCIAISPDERYLAVGETGTQPRILIFSLAPDSNDFPILSIVEHNFGVLGVKFSSDSRYLLSIGDTHDGFIYLWKINGLSLEVVGSNRCTSQINGVLWVDDLIITFGVRHIKIWKFEEFEKRSTIQGKNVILGNSINSNFVYATEGCDDDNDLLFLNSHGEIYGYNLESNTLIMRYVLDTEKLGVIKTDGNKVWLGGNTLRQLPIEKLSKELVKSFDGNLDSPTKVKFTPKITFLEKISERFLIYTTSIEEIILYDIDSQVTSPLIDSLSKSVTGIKTASNGKVVNWTKDGVLKIIEEDTLNLKDLIKIEIPEIPNKVIENHLTALELTQSNEIVAGDAYGNLSIYDLSGKVTLTIAAHEFSINDLCYFQIEEVEFIVSTGRDRMIQVFARSDTANIEDVTSSWSIYQTLDEHKGNLLKLLYKERKIYVSSADRSVSVHRFSIKDNEIIITKEKSFSLKSTPSTIALYNDDLMICTMDKNITIYNSLALESSRSFKLYDDDNESLLVDNALITAQGLLICSCTDKSVRVFNYSNGKQISANWGHSDAIKFLLSVPPNHIITLSSNGCLFSWLCKTAEEPSQSTIQKYSDLTPPKVTRKIKKLPSGTPLRRVVNNSPASRTPTTNRLQSTARLTPTTRLNSTANTNLSPSPGTTSSPLLMKTTRMSPKGTPTPAPKPKIGNMLTTASRQTRLYNDNKVSVDEILLNLRRFKENMDSYTVEEVSSVKKELKDIFHYEEELLQSYNALILSSMTDLKHKD